MTCCKDIYQAIRDHHSVCITRHLEEITNLIKKLTEIKLHSASPKNGEDVKEEFRNIL